jgi:hypothetical protein
MSIEHIQEQLTAGNRIHEEEIQPTANAAREAYQTIVDEMSLEGPGYRDFPGTQAIVDALDVYIENLRNRVKAVAVHTAAESLQAADREYSIIGSDNPDALAMLAYNRKALETADNFPAITADIHDKVSTFRSIIMGQIASNMVQIRYAVSDAATAASQIHDHSQAAVAAAERYHDHVTNSTDM